MTRAGSSAPLRRCRLHALAIVLLSLLVAALVAGFAYQQFAERSDERRFPAPGWLVDVGGHRLHVQCAGEGSPTIVLEAGLGNDVNHWAGLFDLLASEHRVCAYDRAGLGWSEAGPLPRSARQIVDEASRLLDRAGERPPFVLVGHSNGGAYARLLAAARPQDVAGIVLVDPNVGHPEGCTELPFAMRAAYGGLVALADFGVPRLLLPVLFPLERSALPQQAREAHGALRARSAALRATWSETGAGCAMTAAADAAGWPAGARVEVLSAQRRPATQDWVPEAHRSLAAAAGGQWHEVPDSGHWIQLQAPGAVRDAVRRVATRAQATDAPLAGD
jgi:pimeloyl-ACP methyl ester carboxylesterase